MTMVTLLNTLARELGARNDSQLAVKLGTVPETISRLRHATAKPLSAEFTLRCYDYAGFSIEKTRELYWRK